MNELVSKFHSQIDFRPISKIQEQIEIKQRYGPQNWKFWSSEVNVDIESKTSLPAKISFWCSRDSWVAKDTEDVTKEDGDEDEEKWQKKTGYLIKLCGARIKEVRSCKPFRNQTRAPRRIINHFGSVYRSYTLNHAGEFLGSNRYLGSSVECSQAIVGLMKG